MPISRDKATFVLTIYDDVTTDYFTPCACMWGNYIILQSQWATRVWRNGRGSFTHNVPFPPLRCVWISRRYFVISSLK